MPEIFLIFLFIFGMYFELLLANSNFKIQIFS
jgi:hypothetical protein